MLYYVVSVDSFLQTRGRLKKFVFHLRSSGGEMQNLAVVSYRWDCQPFHFVRSFLRSAAYVLPRGEGAFLPRRPPSEIVHFHL